MNTLVFVVLAFLAIASVYCQDVIHHGGYHGGHGISSRYFVKDHGYGYGGYGLGYGGYGLGYGGYGLGYGGYGLGGYGGYY